MERSKIQRCQQNPSPPHPVPFPRGEREPRAEVLENWLKLELVETAPPLSISVSVSVSHSQIWSDLESAQHPPFNPDCLSR